MLLSIDIDVPDVWSLEQIPATSVIAHPSLESSTSVIAVNLKS